ncbi:hypothetical protein BpHYR1_028601 [Brachionus plicatilis]|uniref:Uncharacterized protein n=1 Tax=Brachionus plicatilis TaxID=10195 RepID=A0A3M7QS69_BRAPC|nr:hypothetical protein BpHYR1_028601 [Brachionus plicatilis]
MSNRYQENRFNYQFVLSFDTDIIMENQENFIQDENSTIKNETELSSSENDSKPEMNETQLDLSDTFPSIFISKNHKSSNAGISPEFQKPYINSIFQVRGYESILKCVMLTKKIEYDVHLKLGIQNDKNVGLNQSEPDS